MTPVMPSALDASVTATLARLDASAARAGAGAVLAFGEARRRIEAATVEARRAAEVHGLPLDAPPASASARRETSRADALAALDALATRLRGAGGEVRAQLAGALDAATANITRGASPALAPTDATRTRALGAEAAAVVDLLSAVARTLAAPAAPAPRGAVATPHPFAALDALAEALAAGEALAALFPAP